MTGWLRTIFDVRREEIAQTTAMFIYIFLVIATLTIVKSVRQSLFLQNFGAESLPYVYLLIAVIAGTIATIYQRAARNIPLQRIIAGSLLVIISNLVIFRFLLDLNWGPLTYILYVWVAVYGVLANVQFWTFANYLYDPRQAKRLFALMGVGATSGGIAGGYITQFGAGIIGTENLMLVCAGFMGINIFLLLYVWRSQKATIEEAARAQRFKNSSAEKTDSGFKLILETRYLKLIMLVIALSIIISTVIDNQFGFVVAENIPDKDAKTSFYGQFFTWLGWASFTMQFLFTSRLIKRFGIGAALLFLPVSLFFGSGMFVLFPMLLTGLLVKIADGTFRYTIHKASLELLYLPLSIGVKNKTKAFIDMFTDRASKGLAAILILVMTSVLGYQYQTLSWVLMGLTLVWIGVAIFTYREYVRTFRDSLVRHKIDEDALIISNTDGATIGALADALKTDNPVSLDKTLDTITGVKSPEFVDPLIALAHRKEPSIAIKALDRLAEQDDPAAAAVADLLETASIPIAARALQLICNNEDNARQSLEEYLTDERPRVRLVAILCAVRLGDTEPVEKIAEATIDAMLQDPAADQVDSQREIAGMLAELPAGELTIKYLGQFLQVDDPDVRALTIKAVGRQQTREFVEPLIGFLGDRRLRYLARDSLAEYGEAIVGTLEDYFKDRRTLQAIRQYLPRVFERIATQRAADVLIDHLDDSDERVRFAVLRSLGRVRAKQPKLDYSSGKISTRLMLELSKVYRYKWWVMTAIDGDDSALLRKTLTEKTDKTLDRVFRLLAMRFPPTEVYSAYRALFSDNVRVRSNAIEYLDNVLTGPNKSLVLPLVEGRPTVQKVRRGLAAFNNPAERWPDILRTQTAQEDDWLAACALYTIWATGTEPLYKLIDREPGSDRTTGPLVAETVKNLRKRLTGDKTNDTH